MNPGAPRPKDGVPLLLAPNDNSAERAAPSDTVPGPSGARKFSVKGEEHCDGHQQAQGVWMEIEQADPKAVVEEKVDKFALAMLYQGLPEELVLSIAG
ncbi:hypothetical protein AgCh_009882 [Apium graveolens]